MKNQVRMITFNPDLFVFSKRPTRAGDVKHRINFEQPYEKYLANMTQVSDVAPGLLVCGCSISFKIPE
jgi:hypothetical protein